MTAKEYLWQIEKWQKKIIELDEECEDEIERLGQKIAVLYNQASGMKAITYDKDRVQVSPMSSLEELEILIEDAKKEYRKAISTKRKETDRQISKLQGKIDSIISQIEALGDSRHIDVLKLRYVSGKRWEQIAIDMKYGFRHVLRLHGDALSAFADRYKDVL